MSPNEINRLRRENRISHNVYNLPMYMQYTEDHRRSAIKYVREEKIQNEFDARFIQFRFVGRDIQKSSASQTF